MPKTAVWNCGWHQYEPNACSSHVEFQRSSCFGYQEWIYFVNSQFGHWRHHIILPRFNFIKWYCQVFVLQSSSEQKRNIFVSGTVVYFSASKAWRFCGNKPGVSAGIDHNRNRAACFQLSVCSQNLLLSRLRLAMARLFSRKYTTSVSQLAMLLQKLWDMGSENISMHMQTKDMI